MKAPTSPEAAAAFRCFEAFNDLKISARSAIDDGTLVFPAWWRRGLKGWVVWEVSLPFERPLTASYFETAHLPSHELRGRRESNSGAIPVR
jgi:hypothetical protein